jgi:hypothetical protein
MLVAPAHGVIDQVNAIEREVAKLAANIAKPVLVNVSVEVEGANAVRVYPRTTPDLFAQDELLITGRIRGKGTAKFIFKGLLGGKTVTCTKSGDLSKTPARPWVGKLWAQHRIDHLLEELALSSKDSAEMKNEVLELALAYNFVTPYTSFLAIPESELGEMKGTLDDARKRKQKIMADNADAAALKEQEANQQSIGGSAPTITADSTAAPAPAQRFADASDDGDDEDYEGGVDEEEDSERGASPISASSEVHKRGCAGCATGNGSEASLLVLCVGLLVLRRRRRG